jgi:hypothetical protein
MGPDGRPARVRTYFDRSRLTVAATRRELASVADDLLEQAAEVRRQWDKLGDTLRAAGADAPGHDGEEGSDDGDVSPSSARLVAVDMASDGASREEVEAYLTEELGIDEPAPILDEVFPAGPDEPAAEPSPPTEEHTSAAEANRLSRLFARNRE